MSKTKIFLTFLSISCQLLFSASANIFDHKYIENLAKQSVEQKLSADLHSDKGKQITVTATPLDPRLVIQPCENQLQANIPENITSRNVNVKITCDGSIPWNIYVPVKVETKIPVVVATHSIDKGSILTEENISLSYLPALKVRGEVITDITTVVGAKAKRNISRGKAISRKHTCLVCKGDNVTIEAAGQLLSIKTSGTSISYGHIGDKVRIRNDSSGKLVSGIVTGLNKVTINL